MDTMMYILAFCVTMTTILYVADMIAGSFIRNNKKETYKKDIIESNNIMMLPNESNRVFLLKDNESYYYKLKMSEDYRLNKQSIIVAQLSRQKSKIFIMN